MTQTHCSSCGEELSLKEAVGEKLTDCFCGTCKKAILIELLGFEMSPYLIENLKKELFPHTVDCAGVIHSDDEMVECSYCGESIPSSWEKGECCDPDDDNGAWDYQQAIKV